MFGDAFAQQRAALGLALAGLVMAMRPASSAAPLEQFTAVAVNLGGVRRGAPTTIDVVRITIDRWSTAAERTTLVDAFRANGQWGFLRELAKKKPAGRVELPNAAGARVRFARQMPAGDGGRRIVAAVDREGLDAAGASELRTLEYPFTVVELRVNRDGVGEGRWLAFTTITDLLTLVAVDFKNRTDAAVRLIDVKPSR